MQTRIEANETRQECGKDIDATEPDVLAMHEACATFVADPAAVYAMPCGKAIRCKESGLRGPTHSRSLRKPGSPPTKSSRSESSNLDLTVIAFTTDRRYTASTHQQFVVLDDSTPFRETVSGRLIDIAGEFLRLMIRYIA
jgi:hypothetical protein